MTLAPGARLGPYEILELLGSGGMGEVYRAHDTRLERDVAIKVVPAAFAADPDRLRRFEHEARAASALNHPNILAVHDFGTHDGAPFLVTELLEGESLRDRLKSGPLPVRKAVELAVQVCSGLAAAHEKGIVHRDVKPENLFVTRDNRVKILDFGLAKLRTLPQDAAAAPTALHTTEPGTVMGTVAYMSPEQVRGQAVDHRSDIFSLGAALYEMVTGKAAFARGTPADTMSAILKEEPPELASAEPATPLPMARAILHCLEKLPEERYQSARDLAFDLQAVTGSTGASAGAAGRAIGSKRLLNAASLAGLILVVGLCAEGAFIAGRLTAQHPNPPVFKRLTFQRGTLGNARFSPDGRTVIYSAAWDGRATEVFETRTDSLATRALGLPGIFLHAVSRTGELALGRAPAWYNWEYGPLAVAPVSGSAPRDLLADVSWADWSPDGRTLAVVRRVGGENRLEVPPGQVIARTSGWFGDVRRSPDGRRIAFAEHSVVNDTRGHVVIGDVSGQISVTTREFSSVMGLAWSPDGSEVWFSSGGGGVQQDLLAMTPTGTLRTVARFPTDVLLRDVAPDGRVLLASRRGGTGIRAWSSVDDKERELGWLAFPWPRDLSADGRQLLFDEEGETAGPTYAVYLRATDGSPPVRLGEGAACALSPDGQSVLAIHYGPPHQLVSISTGSADRISLPRGPVETYQLANWLPDGRQVVFIGAEHGRPQRTWVQEYPGGLPAAVTPEGTVGVTTSPDGRWVAAVTQDLDLGIYPLQGGEPRLVAKLAPREIVSQWSTDGRTLFGGRGGTRFEAFGIDVRKGQRKPWRTIEVSDPAGVFVSTFIVTRDGRSYAYGYLRFLDELYLVEGLK